MLTDEPIVKTIWTRYADWVEKEDGDWFGLRLVILLVHSPFFFVWIYLMQLSAWLNVVPVVMALSLLWMLFGDFLKGLRF